MVQVTMDELTMIELYRRETQQATIREMDAIQASDIEDEQLRSIFCSAREKLRRMSQSEFSRLEFWNTLAETDET